MRLRPELVLLQKTMVTVEGVARRIDPEHDIWAAAEPVVARWIARELSPAARLRDFARDARAVVSALARLADPSTGSELSQPPPAEPAAAPEPAAPRDGARAALWFFAGAAISALSFLLAVTFRLIGAR
jgi:ubiquinone biosynthesis protein